MSLLSHIVDKRTSHLILRKIVTQIEHNTTRFLQTTTTNNSTPGQNMTEKSFLPKRALVLRKFSRLEYERLCHPNLTEEQLALNVSCNLSLHKQIF